MAEDSGFLRGAFIAYEPDGYPDKKRVIPFRFNPEVLTRQLSVEQSENPGGPQAGGAPSGGGSGNAATEQSPDASSGATKHSFNVMIRFDLHDRLEASSKLPAELGVAPEIAALEDLLYPAQAESEANSDGTEPVDARPRRPTVLFVWGRKRVYPVKITSMSINETIFNSQLYPIRAEIDCSLEVLGESEARDNLAVQRALSFTTDKRRELSTMFLNNTADQSSNILPL